MAIRSFRNRQTQAIAIGTVPKGFPADLLRSAQRKLRIPDSAQGLGEIGTPPGNRLEALRGDRAGQHSIRINDQWRLCFRWTGRDAEDVEIVDYH